STTVFPLSELKYYAKCPSISPPSGPILFLKRFKKANPVFWPRASPNAITLILEIFGNMIVNFTIGL
ncbi:6725_t:CDS:1, partial [Dentiscutata erythropus]